MRLAFCAASVLAVAGLAPGQPAPGGKGVPYRAPGGNLGRELLWASACEEPAGQGLAFSGQSQSADDGRPHTRVKEGDAWRPIGEELRKANPLQRRHDALWDLRTRLKNAATRARFIFFEGRPAADEKAYLDENVNPAMTTLAADLAAETRQWQGLTDLTDYWIGQARFAHGHVSAAAAAIKPLTGGVTPEMLAALRQAQQHLEIAAEAFDAEPPPRVVSPVVYDPGTKLYVLFGGDHFDYLTNDTWVFDSAQRRWFQRHPEAAPAPRGDHRLTAAGDGTVTLFGGFTYTSKTDYASNQYCSIGDGEWVYDVAKNRWTGSPGQAMQPPDTRVYRTGPYLPEHFMQGPRPNAQANEAGLKALPVNTWVKMGVPQFLFLNRDWGTVALDPDRDLLVYWSGGHCVHTGSDVPHYHLATNRWELHAPIEMALGFIGASGVGVGGRNFNGRPWMSNHTWKAYVYDTGLKKLVVVGRNNQKLDRYTYLYDPDLGDWAERFKVPDGMNVSPLDVKVCVTPKGVLAWTRDSNLLYLLDRATLTWNRLKRQGALPMPMVDSCGLIYDPKRDRVLFVQKNYDAPFSGQMYALDMRTLEVAALSPAGMDRMSWLRGGGLLREVVYDPPSDLFVWAAKARGASQMLGYDPAGNRWVALTIQGSAPFGVSTGMVYDPKRQLIWLVQGAGQAGEVFVLRLDAGAADVKPVGDLGGAPAPGAGTP